MTRNEFIVKAITMLYSFDDAFHKYVKQYAEGLQIPEHMVIQNTFINRMAEEGAKKRFTESFTQTLDEFIYDLRG